MEMMPRRPPARGTLPRAGAGGMDHWQTGRKHGCPALGRPLRRWNKTEHHSYGEQCISEATSSKELYQARSNCRVSLITASLPASLPFSHLLKGGGGEDNPEATTVPLSHLCNTFHSGQYESKVKKAKFTSLL